MGIIAKKFQQSLGLPDLIMALMQIGCTYVIPTFLINRALNCYKNKTFI